jgi:cell division protein FtsW
MGTATAPSRVRTFRSVARPARRGFQVIQSIIAVGTGGVWGRGLMNGVLFFLPEPHTDFIYSVISKSWADRRHGGAAVLRAHRVARASRVAARAGHVRRCSRSVLRRWSRCRPCSTSVALGLLPTKGIPLPFVGFGGSSLLINLLGMGILLNVSQHDGRGGR